METIESSMLGCKCLVLILLCHLATGLVFIFRGAKVQLPLFVRLYHLKIIYLDVMSVKENSV